MKKLLNIVTVKVTVKSQTPCSCLTINRCTLSNTISVKVTQKSREIGRFCDFIVTNILVTSLITNTYTVTSRYIRRAVLLSQNVRPSAAPIPQGLIVTLKYIQTSEIMHQYSVNRRSAKLNSVFYSVELYVTFITLKSGSGLYLLYTRSIPALYLLYISLYIRCCLSVYGRSAVAPSAQ